MGARKEIKIRHQLVSSFNLSNSDIVLYSQPSNRIVPSHLRINDLDQTSAVGVATACIIASFSRSPVAEVEIVEGVVKEPSLDITTCRNSDKQVTGRVSKGTALRMVRQLQTFPCSRCQNTFAFVVTIAVCFKW